jgi:hypothetical protein
MRRPILAAVVAACLPCALLAQKGKMPDVGSTQPADAGPGSSAKTPTSYDLADLNPATLLIKQRKKSQLADSTVTQLKAVEKKIKERNAGFFATYDSVRKWTIPLASNESSISTYGLRGGSGDSKLTQQSTSPAEQAKMQSSLRDLRNQMADFRERHKTDAA